MTSFTHLPLSKREKTQRNRIEGKVLQAAINNKRYIVLCYEDAEIVKAFSSFVALGMYFDRREVLSSEIGMMIGVRILTREPTEKDIANLIVDAL